MSQKARRDRGHQPESSAGESGGILNERVLVLVFESMRWDIHAVCATASVNRRLRAVAKRVLWRELCSRRAPRMAEALTADVGRMGGGWHTLAKLMFFCCGSPDAGPAAAGHFVGASRFSKTSGRSFLPRGCRGDVLFVSDPCEHQMARIDDDDGGGGGDDLGIYRGVFKGFMRSRTRASLIGKGAELDDLVRCPYCGSRVWSMAAARLVPRSAARRLGSRDDVSGLEYFVCLNGHLHGACWLAPLSTEEENDSSDSDDRMVTENQKRRL